MDWDPGNGCSQCLCPGGFLTAFCFLGLCSKISKWVWHIFQTPASGLGLRVCEILCTTFKSIVLIPHSPQLSWTTLMLVFKAGILGAHLPGAGPRLEALMWGSDPLFLGETLWDSSCLWVMVLGVWVETPLHFLPSYPAHCGSSLYLCLWRIFSASVQVILRDSCSVSHGNFSMPMGGGELRVFCRLAPNTSAYYFIAAQLCPERTRSVDNILIKHVGLALERTRENTGKISYVLSAARDTLTGWKKNAKRNLFSLQREFRGNTVSQRVAELENDESLNWKNWKPVFHPQFLWSANDFHGKKWSLDKDQGKGVAVRPYVQPSVFSSSMKIVWRAC